MRAHAAGADYFLHEYILALWGMPLGEMLHLERLSARCRDVCLIMHIYSSTGSNQPGCSVSQGVVIGILDVESRLMLIVHRKYLDRCLPRDRLR